MNVRILSDDTYALYDGETQVEQGPITAEMRDGAKAKKLGIKAHLERVVEKVRVEKPLGVGV